MNSQDSAHFVKFLGSQDLRKEVGGHLVGGAVAQFDFAGVDSFLDEEEPDIDVLAPSVVFGVFRDFDRRLIVLVDHCSTALFEGHFLQ